MTTSFAMAKNVKSAQSNQTKATPPPQRLLSSDDSSRTVKYDYANSDDPQHAAIVGAETVETHLKGEMKTLEVFWRGVAWKWEDKKMLQQNYYDEFTGEKTGAVKYTYETKQETDPDWWPAEALKKETHYDGKGTKIKEITYTYGPLDNVSPVSAVCQDFSDPSKSTKIKYEYDSTKTMYMRSETHYSQTGTVLKEVSFPWQWPDYTDYFAGITMTAYMDRFPDSPATDELKTMFDKLSQVQNKRVRAGQGWPALSDADLAQWQVTDVETDHAIKRLSNGLVLNFLRSNFDPNYARADNSGLWYVSCNKDGSVKLPKVNVTHYVTDDQDEVPAAQTESVLVGKGSASVGSGQVAVMKPLQEVHYKKVLSADGVGENIKTIDFEWQQPAGGPSGQRRSLSARRSLSEASPPAAASQHRLKKQVLDFPKDASSNETIVYNYGAQPGAWTRLTAADVAKLKAMPSLKALSGLTAADIAKLKALPGETTATLSLAFSCASLFLAATVLLLLAFMLCKKNKRAAAELPRYAPQHKPTSGGKAAPGGEGAKAPQMGVPRPGRTVYGGARAPATPSPCSAEASPAILDGERAI